MTGETSKLELWVAALGILVAGVVATSWLIVGPTPPSRIDIAVLVAVVTAFAWAAAVIGGSQEGERPMPRRVDSALQPSACGEIWC